MANSPTRSVVDVGTVIADTYTIEALIGRGGMGSVFLASHQRLPGKQVAIKILHAELQDPDVITRFKREAEIASRLNHPNIVAVHDYNVTPEGTPYLVLDFLQGESLAQRLALGALPLDTVFSIARQVGSALAAAHRAGIVHRDLKPANIFLCPTEVDGKVVEIAKVLDFGISRRHNSQTVKTQEGTLLGTPQYMAPEQARGDHANVTSRTDVFALGAIVYEMLAGHPAFDGENIPEVVFKVVYEQPRPLGTEAPTVPPNVIATVDKAMAKAAAERFSSVSMFVEQLTGEKAPVVRTPSLPPLGDAPPGPRGRSTGKAAYDHTMASGEHGRAPTPLPVLGPAIDVQANTVASLSPDGDGAIRAMPAVGAPTIAMPDPSTARRSRAPMILIALGGAAIGALVLYLVTRGGGTPPVDAAKTAVTPDSAPAAIDAVVAAADAVEVVAPVDSAPVVVANDAAMKPADAAVKPDAAVAVPNEPDDPTVKQAFAEYARGDYAGAQATANQVLYAPHLEPVQRARARAVYASASCKLQQFEQGKIGYRQLGGFPKLRSMIVAACGATVTE